MELPSGMMMRCQMIKARFDGAIVAADQPRSLGNEQGLTAWTVVNPFRDLSGHKTGQVGSQAGDQACGNHAAGRHYIR